jgi:ABC-2 type transport system ATP-binding protein
VTSTATVTAPATGSAVDPVIATHGLTKHYGSVRAVNDLDLAVPRGSVFGFLGPNGSGKTTTIRMLLALVRPTKGEARILGEPVRPEAAVLDAVGALVERPAFYPFLSAYENLGVFAAARGVSTSTSPALCRAALERVGLADVAARKVGGFSTGMRQRLGIGLALLDAPPVIILDEPTSGLDPEGTVDVRNVITALAHDHTTVFLSTHLLNEAEQVCTQLAVIAKGRIVTQGSTSDLFATREHLVVRFTTPAERDTAMGVLRAGGMTVRQTDVAGMEIDGQPDGRETIQQLAGAGIYPAEVALRRPSLEKIYLELTDEAPTSEEPAPPEATS